MVNLHINIVFSWECSHPIHLYVVSFSFFFLEDFDAQLLARMTARERAIQADRDIREQQDREYQQMLQEDQAKEEYV